MSILAVGEGAMPLIPDKAHLLGLTSPKTTRHLCGAPVYVTTGAGIVGNGGAHLRLRQGIFFLTVIQLHAQYTVLAGSRLGPERDGIKCRVQF